MTPGGALGLQYVIAHLRADDTAADLLAAEIFTTDQATREMAMAWVVDQQAEMITHGLVPGQGDSCHYADVLSRLLVHRAALEAEMS